MTNARILIVEDEIVVRLYIEARLKDLGYEVVDVVSSGQEAIDRAGETRPDLILMDIKLQGEMDGVDAAGQIRKRFGIPVIYLTAYTDEETLLRAKVTEPYGFVLKPFLERELHSNIEMALHKYTMETKLKENERWLTTMLRSIGEAVIATDVEGRVKFMNPIAAELTGWEQQTAAGRQIVEVFKIVDPKTRSTAGEPVAQVLHEKQPLYLRNRPLLTALDGTERVIDANATPILDDCGTCLGAVLVFRDLTEQRALEKESLRAQRLESIQVLVGGIAHDFNNYLTAVLGFVGLAKAQAEPDTDMSDLLAKAEKSSRKAQSLTRQLLNFSRGNPPVDTSLGVAAQIKETTELVLRGSPVMCDFVIVESLWQVDIDEVSLDQVITNLIMNANQAMPDGGTIRVVCENVPSGGQRGVPLGDDDHIKISITDRGPGIPEEHLAQVFEPYFTTKPAGNGLGLAVTSSIVKRHRGHITIESTGQEGTTFSVYLPASRRGNVPANPTVDTTTLINGLALKDRRILVMDDDESVREVVSTILEKVGCDVDVAEDGNRALELYRSARASQAPYDVLLLDMTVQGGMGGTQTLQQLVEIDPDVKAVLSSGYTTDPKVTNFRDHGFSAAVTKPYRISELCQVLGEVLGMSPLGRQGEQPAE